MLDRYGAGGLTDQRRRRMRRRHAEQMINDVLEGASPAQVLEYTPTEFEQILKSFGDTSAWYVAHGDDPDDEAAQEMAGFPSQERAINFRDYLKLKGYGRAKVIQDGDHWFVEPR